MANAKGPRPLRVYMGRDVTEAELCVAFLLSAGIPAEVENPLTHQVLSAVEKVLDQERGVGVIVPSTREADAK